MTLRPMPIRGYTYRPDCVTLSDICSEGYEDSYPMVTICLTANDAVGRWRVLCQVAMLCVDKHEQEAYRAYILLREAMVVACFVRLTKLLLGQGDRSSYCEACKYPS